MFVIRPAKLADLNEIERCALTAGPGLTHLPRHHGALEELIHKSIKSFSEQVDKPRNEQYLFVLEDVEKGLLGGTCGIVSRTGVPIPFYVYRIETLLPTSNRLPLPREPRFLRLAPYINGPTEICGLYLLPDYRHGGLGKLLSLSRFLFIASHLKRFTHTIIANMRGIINQGVSPFWNGLGRHFLNVELQEVMEMRTNNEHLISDIFPPHPICVALLAPDAQNAIAQVHPNTVPALSMLSKAGFHKLNEIDPVDGGPIIAAEANKIHSIQSSVVGEVGEITNQELKSDKYIIANTLLDFRACFGNVDVTSDKKLVLSESIAKALGVRKGDLIRYAAT